MAKKGEKEELVGTDIDSFMVVLGHRLMAALSAAPLACCAAPGRATSSYNGDYKRDTPHVPWPSSGSAVGEEAGEEPGIAPAAAGNISNCLI